MRRHLRAALLAATLLGSGTALGTSQFSYQGYLEQDNAPVTGTYNLRFMLFDSATGGNMVTTGGVSNPITRGVEVIDGHFTVALDFGAAAFVGEQRWLAISVQPIGGPPLAELSPRQPVTPVLRALHADDAAVAQSVPDGSIGAAEINTDQVQRRIAGNCPVDQAIAKINADGSVVCGAARQSNVTQIVGRKGMSGSGSSGNVSLSIAANGIVSNQIADNHVGTVHLMDGAVAAGKLAAGSVTDDKINPAQVQMRTGAGCPAGRVATAVRINGTFECGVTDWHGINSNVISGGSATVTGGGSNTASGVNAVVSGGSFNTASGAYATVTGGSLNHASGQYSTISGGSLNGATGYAASVLGGFNNCAGGSYSLAMGRRAKVRPGHSADLYSGCLTAPRATTANGDQGTFIFADSQDADFVSTGNNQFLVRAKNGVLFNRDSTTVSLPAGRFINTETGAYLSTGGTWTNASSRTLKNAFEVVDAGRILDKVLTLPMTTWEYIKAPEAGRHLGPVAEDFHAAFGLGDRDDEISTADAGGVTLAAIKGLALRQEYDLNTLIEQTTQANAQLRADIAATRARVEALLARNTQEVQP